MSWRRSGKHEEHAEPSAEQSKEKDAPVFGVERVAEENQRGHGEDHARGKRFAGRAGGLDDVVFENGGAAEGAQDADGKNRDGNGCGDGEPGAKADVDGDGAEKNAEERAEDYGAKGEFPRGLFGADEGLEFGRRRGGIPKPWWPRISLNGCADGAPRGRSARNIRGLGKLTPNGGSRKWEERDRPPATYCQSGPITPISVFILY